MELHPADHVVLILYLGAMMFLGWRLSKGQTTDEEYFLGGRRLPWFAVGVSIIASLLSSISFLAYPGVIWRFGFGQLISTFLSFPIDLLVILLVTIPFFARFRFTSAYEYLEHRFDLSVRLLGASMFLMFVSVLMGVIVLVSSRALSVASGIPLMAVIATVGIVATVYTMMGGIRAVVWTDVIQVAILLGGGIFTIIYVAAVTGSGPWDWIDVVSTRDNERFTFFSLDPTLPATVVTFTLSDSLWVIVAHCANQMTMQRYFSTVDIQARKRSFVTGTLVGLCVILILSTVGASLVYYFTQGPESLPQTIDVASGKDRDSIFPFFVATRMPAGLAGAIFAALLAAAMSTIDSGVNAFATVATVDFGRLRKKKKEGNNIFQARVITLAVGGAVTLGAMYLDTLTGADDILTILPKTFNSLVGPMGGIFFAGMLIPRASSRAVWIAAIVGFLTALGVAYSRELLQLLGPSTPATLGAVLDEEFSQRLFDQGFGFTWIVICSSLASIGTAWLMSFVFPNRDEDRIRGLTWQTRHQRGSVTS